MKVNSLICAALLCTAQWGHGTSLSKKAMQNTEASEKAAQRETTGIHFTQSGSTSGGSENTLLTDTIISAANFEDSTSLDKIGKISVQPVETRSSKPSPEPGTVFLLGTGIAGIIFITRRRKKR